MKKLLLTLTAVLAGTFGSFAEVDLDNPTQVTNATVSEVFATDGSIISLQCLDTNGGAGYYFNGAAAKTQALTEDNLYVVRLQENGQFALQSYTNNKYVGSNGTNFNGHELVAMKDNLSDAAMFTAVATACTGNWTTKMEGVVNGTNTIRLIAHVGDATKGYLNTNNTGDVPKYFDGAAGFSIWYVFTYPELTFPIAGEWYRIKNKETRGGSTGGNYLGYYPANPWYIVNQNQNCNTKTTMPIIASGKIAHLEDGASEADIDGQLWQFVAGEGANADKHCLVNKAYPNGAISTMVANNQGQPQANANNTSRFAYTFDRAAKPDSVAWFTIGFPEEGYVSFWLGDNQDNPYLCVAGDGQKNQVHRYGTNNNQTYKWIPERYVEETYNAQEVFDEGVAELKAIAEGCAAMKAVIGNEACPIVTMPEGTTGATMADAIAAANAEYSAYIAKFNNKWVTIYNNRRGATNGQTPWLSIYKKANGVVGTNTLAEPNDDSVWLMNVESNKLRFYNRTTGYALRSELLTPADMGTGVRLHIEGTNDYVNIDTGSSDVTQWSTANDAGSIWTIAAAEYEFAEPQVSTKEAPRYYRILSDRLMVKGQNPNLKVDGEDRAASGAGEAVAYSNLNSNGIYWRIEDAGNGDGSVKIFNLVDGYAMKGDNLATGEAEDAAVFYLNKLSNTPYADNQSNFSIVNSYALGSTSAVNSSSLNLNGSNAASVASWSPTGDSRDCFTFGTQGNGAIFYFIEVSEAEIEHATAAYIAAVKNRIGAVSIVDDSENLAALSNKEAVEEYTRLVTEHNEAYNTLATIDGVNTAKRNGGVVNNSEAIAAEVNSIFDEYIVGQHVQISNRTTGWNTYYMIDNGTRIKPATSDEGLETLWLITKGENGYILTNVGTDRMVGFGTNNDSQPWPTTAVEAEAQDFLFNYVPKFGKFTIRKEGTTESERRAIHQSGNDAGENRIVKWSASGIENSHWYISALAEADVVVEPNGQGGHIVRINGEFTEKVAADDVVVEIYRLADEVGEETEEAPMLLAADENATLHASFTLSHFGEDKTAAIDEPLTEGNYAIKVPGAVVTKNGKHTRGMSGTFSVAADGVVTGVKEVAAAEEAVKVYYDLQGRRVANPGHGLYICNGKKILL